MILGVILIVAAERMTNFFSHISLKVIGSNDLNYNGNAPEHLDE